jgi:putative ABC transport system substrate-binding protein
MSFYRAGMLGLALFTILQVAETNAQTIPVLGYVAAKNTNPKRLEIFKKGLAELGYVEGKNIRIKYREAVLDAEYNGVMTELVDRKIDIIAAANVAATRAAAKATKTIPVVMLAVFDPVGIGVVKSLERPSTNVTGTTAYAPQLAGRTFANCSNASSPPSTKWRWLSMAIANNAAQFELLRSEAQKLGIAVESLCGPRNEIQPLLLHRTRDRAGQA